MKPKKIIYALLILCFLFVVAISFEIDKPIATIPNLEVSDPAPKIEQPNKNVDVSNEWSGAPYFFSGTATSTDGTHTITTRAIPTDHPSAFFTPSEFVVTDDSGHEQTYPNPKGAYPFKWVGNTLYAVVSAYESAGDVVTMSMSDSTGPGAVVPLGFTSAGIADVTRSYYAFTGGRQNEPQNVGAMFCTTGSEEPSWAKSDQLGYIDFETGIITVLLSDPNKVYEPVSWSMDSKKILYREYDVSGLSSDDREGFCPSPETGTFYSIDISTRQIQKEESPHIIYSAY